MLTKQAAQALVSRNSERPYIIGNKYQYMTSKLYKHVADHPGTILYRNEDIILVIFKRSPPLLNAHDSIVPHNLT